MWFRIFFMIAASCLWGITIWAATHSSESASVLSRYSNSYFVFLVTIFLISALVTFLHFGSAYRWVFHKRNSLILLIVSLVFSLTCVELLVRVLDPIGISYYEHAKNYHLEKIADDDLYYRHKPNLDQIYQGVSVKTNAFGMRDEPIANKKPRELRVMFLGDSVTFGWGVRPEDIFVRRVGEILEEDVGRPVRTMNTGVGSYNTENEYAVLDRYGDKLMPDLVVLMYVGNDIEPTPGKKFDPWSKLSFQGKSPPEVVQLILGKIWTYRLISHLASHRKGPTETKLSTSSKGFKQSIIALQGISEYCDSANIPLIVFMYRMVPDSLQNDIAHELSMQAAKLNFYFSDVLPWFEGKDIRALVNSPVDSHPNARGHAILASGIASTIQQQLVQGAVGKNEAPFNE